MLTIAALIIGIGIGYAFRSFIGTEIQKVHDRIAALEAQIKAKL